MSFQKCKPHIITCRNFKNYGNNVFRPEIQSFFYLNGTNLGLFEESIFCMFNKHANYQKKCGPAKEAPFMNIELHNAIMKFLKDKSQTSRENYKI